MYELIGYVASVVVAISLMMSSILRLRVLNLVGALLFALYGVLIGSVPVAAVNTFIVGINVFYLFRIFGARESFHILVVPWDSPYLRHLLEHSRDDIRQFIPDAVTPQPQHLTFLILSEVAPVGVVIAEPGDDGTLRIHLDYVLPGYRDYSIGEFLFGENAAFFAERGIHRLTARAGTRRHADYLKRMGFTQAGGAGQGVWEREIGTALRAGGPPAPPPQ